MYRSVLVAACAAGLLVLTACASGPGPDDTPPATGAPDSATSSGTTGPSDPSSSGPGSSDPGSGGPGSSGPGQPSSSQPPVPPPGATAPTGAPLTLVGTVTVSEIEMGCLMLEGYELFGGDRAVLQPGRRVRVTGEIAADVLSICQQGPILRVISAEPA